jgi:protein-disulfide isomerase
MLKGDRETAKLYYYDYTDIMCPYCDKFANAVAAHEEEFQKDYIEGKNILFEIRLTDALYVYHKDEHESAVNSRNSALNAYCAADQDKFWEYYNGILAKLYTDYHSKGIGIDQYAERIPKLEMDYFKDVAKNIDGLDYDKFSSCVDNEEKADELDKNTQRALSIMPSGAPYFVFGNYKTSGFLGKWDAENYDWEQAKLLLDAGL